MPAGTFLYVTVVMGLLVVGVGLAVARFRRRDSPAPRRPLGRPVGTSDQYAATVVFVVAVATAVAATVVGPGAVVYGSLTALVGGFFAWGVYSFGRSRGLPKAHSVGLSVWLFGVVLVGVVAVQLLLA